MKKEYEQDVFSSRISLNLFLLTTSITVFILIMSLNLGVLKENLFLTLQLTLSIPILLTSSLSNITAQKRKNILAWQSFGSTTYILGYALLTNVFGILIGTRVNAVLAAAFFIVNWVLVVSYSYLKLHLKESSLKERLKKDVLFISIQLFFGLLPALGIYL